jgi:hypothetical protein
MLHQVLHGLNMSPTGLRFDKIGVQQHVTVVIQGSDQGSLAGCKG